MGEQKHPDMFVQETKKGYARVTADGRVVLKPAEGVTEQELILYALKGLLEFKQADEGETYVKAVTGPLLAEFNRLEALEDDKKQDDTQRGEREKIILHDSDGKVMCAGEIVDTEKDDAGHTLNVLEFEVRFTTTMRRPDDEFSQKHYDAVLRLVIGHGLAREAERFQPGITACDARWAAVTKE
ncbi:hypothetical protein LCGC14_1036190 [marine sediment metagenome]|uniref:Uncharacterized protein n=1 Tax=marine sediment metagenome TaxID=412755 RepID=A0A0F9QBB0_9ZZZZ